MTPCNYLHTHLGFDRDSIDKDCNADLNAQIEYLGPLDFLLYHTEEVFQPNEFNKNAIKRQSVLWN